MNHEDAITLARKIDYTQPDAPEAVADLLAAEVGRREKAEARYARIKALLIDVESEEAAVCPEDVGFAEYIQSLTKRVAELEAALETSAKRAEHFKRAWGMTEEAARRKCKRAEAAEALVGEALKLMEPITRMVKRATERGLTPSPEFQGIAEFVGRQEPAQSVEANG